MSTLQTVKVSNRYQIAIPSAVRKRLNIQAGDHLIVDIQDGLLLLLPRPSNYTNQLKGLHKALWEKVNSEKYLENERDAWTEP